MIDIIRVALLSLKYDEKGAAMAEYGLLIGLIALVVAGGATVLGQDISTMFSGIGGYLAGIPMP